MRYYLESEMEAAIDKPDQGEAIERRIAQHLAALRADRGWSLEALAERTGISRATLSRLERSELSPTASMLGKLCTVYGLTLSRLMAQAETRPPDLIRASEQASWTDPETGYRRRAVSPPGPGLHGEVAEVQLPPAAVVSYEGSPVPGLEHHLWLLEGTLDLEVDGKQYRLQPGDCVRYVLNGSSRFECKGRRPARYFIAFVHPISHPTTRL